MDIIGHTAQISKNKQSLKKFLACGCDTLEMDFVLTKDNVLIWSHNPIFNNKFINKSRYYEVNQLMTLEDILELINGDINLILDLKWLDRNLCFDDLLRALEIILRYPAFVSVQSFNQDLIKRLLFYRKEVPFVNIGLVVNLFKTFIYRKGNIFGLENLDFLSLSSELWEWPLVGEDYLVYRRLFPKASLYAWTWDSVYSENESRMRNFISKNADGIITADIPLVRKLIK